MPAGVTVRGPAPPDIPREARKHLPSPRPAEVVGEGPLLAIVGDDVHLAHLTLAEVRAEAGGRGDAPAVVASGVSRVLVDACTLHGSVRLDGADDVTLQWNDVHGGRLEAAGCARLRITGGHLRGPVGRTPAVAIVDGRQTHISALAVTGVHAGLAVADTDDLVISGCAVRAVSDAVAVSGSTRVTVSGNRLRGERAIHLRRCNDIEINANSIEWADTAFDVQACEAVQIGSNHIDEARVARACH